MDGKADKSSETYIYLVKRFDDCMSIMTVSLNKIENDCSFLFC